jgi:nitroreductase
MELDKAINQRHSARDFSKTKKTDYKKIIEAIESATKAPLAGNHHNLKFILVSDKAKIKGLAEAAVQDFISSSNYVVVVCSNKRVLEASYHERGKMYSHQQAGAAIENFLLKITDLGLATCWVGAFSDETVKRVLKIPDNIDVEAFFPIGFEIGRAKQKPKPDLDDVLFFNEWDNKYMTSRGIVPGTRT